MSLNIGSGINNYNEFFSAKKSSGRRNSGQFSNAQKSDTQTNRKTKTQYDFTTMGTVRSAVLEEKAKQEMQNSKGASGEPLPDKIVSWHGIDITNTPDIYKVIVPISDEAKQKCYEVVKKGFETTARKAFNDVSNMEDFHSYCKNAVKDIEGLDKLKTHWSISQYFNKIHEEVEIKVRELDPKWDWGQPVKTEVLNEVFGKKFDVSV